MHIILLESFWNPSPLKAGQYSRDPLPDDFRALWKQAGHSRILSPVFGGYTASAEFEALCGYPVLKDAVKFERDLKNDAPCLPRLLAQQGYTTIASHPNVPVFWNRVNAYRRLCFQTYWSLQDFEKVDMVRNFMSDASLYRQVLNKIEPWLENGKPLLNYVVTYFGHWNYPLNDARPTVVQDSSNVPEVGSFASTAYYKAKELMAFPEELNSRDPDALIAVFGDHPPTWAVTSPAMPNPACWRIIAASSHRRCSVSTMPPKVVIDGERGVQRFGTLALYELPARLLRLLHLDHTGPLGLTAPQTAMHVRPIPGLHYLVSETGKVEVCQEPPWTEDCARSSVWLNDVVTVGNDLFVGEQFTMRE